MHLLLILVAGNGELAVGGPALAGIVVLLAGGGRCAKAAYRNKY